MYYISEFCRVCLQYEKPLVDIMKKESESETLINKLKLCVSEVEWSRSTNILMCQTCIEKLNTAFEFKQQCLQSAQALENYISQLIAAEDSDSNRVGGKVCVSLKRNEIKQELVDEYVKLQKEEEESQKPTAFIRVKSGQQLYPQLSNIILTANNSQNMFPNILLNLIPSTAIKYQPNIAIVSKPNNANTTVSPTAPPATPSLKDANQNMFLNINNTIHKIFPIVTQNKEIRPKPSSKVPIEMNISRILTQSKTEELSVEIDPMCFDCSPDDENSTEATADIAKDWEELISSNKIGPDTIKTECNVVPTPAKISESSSFTPVSDSLTITPTKIGPYNQMQQTPTNKFVPIRPKIKDYVTSDLEEKMMEFLNVEHFMAPKEAFEHLNEQIPKSLMCEQCGQICDTLKALRYHIKQFHLGKFPYKCRFCSSVYALRTQYESHMQKHLMPSPDLFAKDTITLEDLSNQNEAILFPNSAPVSLKPLVPASRTPNNAEFAENYEDGQNGVQFENKCEMCPRSFNSPHGLSRHKVRKHNQQTRRKYFVKGMKNAKCDICNREFSTQSYLQLHIKLHYRKNDYRLKVFNKDKYKQDEKNEDKLETSDTPEDCDMKSENIEVSVEPEANECEDVETEHLKEIENEVEDNQPVNDLEAVTDKEKDSNNSKLLEGIKIKINLRNIKAQSKSKEISEDDIEDKPTMDIDCPEGEEMLTNGNLSKKDDAYNSDSHIEQEDGISSASSEALHDINMDCDESVVMSPNVELSEDVESHKDERSSEGRRPSFKIELVDGKAQCSFCYKMFARKQDLKRHVNNIHLKAIQYVCHLCNSRFYEAFHLTRHLRQHNSFMRCTTCMKDFSVFRDLKLHILAVHENSAPTQCGTCGEVFKKLKLLTEHMHQEHDKSIIYKCHICNTEFKESRELTKHLVGHSGMYSCIVCQTTFTTEQELDNHAKYHSGDPTYEEKKYECQICHNKYKKKRYLSAHMNNHHSAKKCDTEIPLNRVHSENDSS